MNRRSYCLLSIMQFLLYLVWSLWMVSTGTYLLNTLGFDGTQVGLIYGAPAIAAMISPFLFGIIADRYLSSDRLMMILQFLSGLLLIWLSQVETFTSFYALMILQSFVFAPTISLANSIVFYHAIDREQEFPKIRLWGTVGFILGSSIVSFLAWETSANALFYAGFASIAMAAFCLFLPHTPPIPQKNTSLKSIFTGEIRSFIFNRSFLVFILCITLIRIPASFYYSFVNPFLLDIGMPQPTLQMSIGQIVEIFVILSVPFMLRRFGIKTVMLIGFGTWALRYLGFAFGNMEESAILIYFSIAVHGVSYSYSSLSAHIFMDKSVPPHLRSTAQGFVVFLTMGLGLLIGTSIAGLVVDHYTLDDVRDWRGIWQFPAVVGFVVVGVFALFFREGALKSEQ